MRKVGTRYYTSEGRQKYDAFRKAIAENKDADLFHDFMRARSALLPPLDAAKADQLTFEEVTDLPTLHARQRTARHAYHTVCTTVKLIIAL